MLRILCILLKVLILMKADIAFSSEDMEDSDSIVHYIINQSSELERVENYIYNDTMRNEVVPENVPTEPTNPRVFIDFENKLKKVNIIVKYRWDEPQSKNGKILKYTVRFWYINQKKFLYFIHNIPSNTKQIPFKLWNILNISDSMMYFQVRAHNENGAGSYTKFVNISSTHENPIPLLLISTPSKIYISDMDSTITYELSREEYRAKEINYLASENKLYWINERSELISYDFDATKLHTNDIYKQITDLDSSAHNLCIDWIARNLYWIQFSNYTRNIMKLDLTLWEQMSIVKYDSILQINESKFLNILPLEGYLHWMELNANNQYVIRQSDLDGKNIKTFLEDKNDNCSCPYKLREASSMQIDNTNIDKPLMYWTLKNHLIGGDIYGCTCHLILSAGSQTFFNYLTIDKANIYMFSNSELESIFLLYTLNKKYAFLESEENAFKHVPKDHGIQVSINSVRALDASLQQYPRTECLIPKIKDYLIKVEMITANSIVVNLPEPDPNDGCEKYHLATTIYNISVSHCLNNDVNKFKHFNVLTHQRHYEIQNLTPLTEYKLELALSNFYVDKLSMNLQFGEDVIQKTDPGKLNAPENVTVQVLTPTHAAVYWMPPKNLNCVTVKYEVHWKSLLFSNDTQNITYQNPHMKQRLNEFERTVDGKFFTIIQPLLSGQEYLINVRVYPENFSNLFTDSIEETANMYSKPNNLNLNGISTNSMNISWIPSVNLISYKLEYRNVIMQEWKIANNIEENNEEVTLYLENLQSGTLYHFRLILRYPEYMEDFIWPDEGYFTFKTLDS